MARGTQQDQIAEIIVSVASHSLARLVVDPARATDLETTVFALTSRTVDHDAPNRGAWGQTLCDALARYSQPLSDPCVRKPCTPQPKKLDHSEAPCPPPVWRTRGRGGLVPALASPVCSTYALDLWSASEADGCPDRVRIPAHMLSLAGCGKTRHWMWGPRGSWSRMRVTQFEELPSAAFFRVYTAECPSGR